MSAGVEESGAIVTVGSGDRRDPNVKATTQEIYSGLVASGQNAWPNVRTDFGAVNSLLSRFFSAGTSLTYTVDGTVLLIDGTAPAGTTATAIERAIAAELGMDAANVRFVGQMLAQTGVETGPILITAVALIVAGLMIVSFGRRYRRPA